MEPNQMGAWTMEVEEYHLAKQVQSNNTGWASGEKKKSGK